MTGLEVPGRLENRGVTHLSIILGWQKWTPPQCAMRHGAADFYQPAEPHKMLERVAATVTASRASTSGVRVFG